MTSTRFPGGAKWRKIWLPRGKKWDSPLWLFPPPPYLTYYIHSYCTSYNTQAIGFLISASAISSDWDQWESYGIDGHKAQKKSSAVKTKADNAWEGEGKHDGSQNKMRRCSYSAYKRNSRIILKNIPDHQLHLPCKISGLQRPPMKLASLWNCRESGGENAKFIKKMLRKRYHHFVRGIVVRRSWNALWHTVRKPVGKYPD